MATLPARRTRVATVDAERSVAFAEVDIEAPGERQVVVRIRYTGVCATDTHGWASGGLIPAAVFGHEWTGTVVAAGPGVTTVAVGDRVVASVGPPCGSCAMCRAGHPDHCDTAFAEANGISDGAPSHGDFAEHVTVAERRVRRALDGLTDEQLGLQYESLPVYMSRASLREPPRASWARGFRGRRRWFGRR